MFILVVYTCSIAMETCHPPQRRNTTAALAAPAETMATSQRTVTHTERDINPDIASQRKPSITVAAPPVTVTPTQLHPSYLQDRILGEEHRYSRSRVQRTAGTEDLQARGVFMTLCDNLGITERKHRQHIKDKTAREIRIRWARNDPTVTQEHRFALDHWIKGSDITDMSSQGVTAQALAEVGVRFDQITRCKWGAHDLLVLGAKWENLVSMGFQPRDIVEDRAKNGPVVLRDMYAVDFDKLQYSFGLTIDEAVLQLGFIVEDFAVLGMDWGKMVSKGLHPAHLDRMGATPKRCADVLCTDIATVQAFIAAEEEMDTVPTVHRAANPNSKYAEATDNRAPGIDSAGHRSTDDSLSNDARRGGGWNSRPVSKLRNTALRGTARRSTMISSSAYGYK